VRRRARSGLVRVVYACALATLSAVSSAAAQDGQARAADEHVAHFEIGLSVQLAYAVAGDRCAQTQSDVISCTGLAFFTFEFTPRYRLTRAWSLGVLAMLGTGDSSNMLRIGAEGQLHLLGDGPVDPTLGLDAGAAFLFDSVPADELGPAESFTSAAPAFGASAGVDFALGETVRLGLGVRFVLVPFGQRETLFSRQPSYDTLAMLSAGLTALYRFGT
jgi:hypothetical protein